MGRLVLSMPDLVPDLGHILYSSLSEIKLIFARVLSLNWIPTFECLVDPSHSQLCLIFYNVTFIIVEKLKQPKCQIIDCLRKLWHIHTIQYNVII